MERKSYWASIPICEKEIMARLAEYGSTCTTFNNFRSWFQHDVSVYYAGSKRQYVRDKFKSHKPEPIGDYSSYKG